MRAPQRHFNALKTQKARKIAKKSKDSDYKKPARVRSYGAKMHARIEALTLGAKLKDVFVLCGSANFPKHFA